MNRTQLHTLNSQNIITEVQQNAVDAMIDAVQNETNLIVSSTAGSGKTFTIEQFSKQYNGIRNVVALAYNKNAAKELEKRCDDSIKTMTLHAAGFRLLGTTYGKLKVQDSIHYFYALQNSGYEETQDKTEKSICKFVASMASRLADMSKETLSSDYANLIARFDYIKTILGGNDYTSEIVQLADDIVETTLGRFATSSKLAYVDMLYIPVKMRLKSAYDVVIVDEAQDVSPLKLMLVRGCMEPKSLILVGDTNQSINQWAGAIPDVLPEIGFQTVRLNVTHRNGKNACEYIQSFFDVDHIAADNVNENDIVGNVDTISAIPDVMKNGLVLSRKNADLVPAWHMLVQSGKTAVIVGNDDLAPKLIKTLQAYDNIGHMLETGKIDVDMVETAEAIMAIAGNVQNALEIVSTMLGLTLCPNGHVMVDRRGKNGYRFLGCSEYPKCRETMPYDNTKTKTDYTLSTVHKQKGATYDNVALLPNLRGLGDNNEEFNVRFVASTRQRNKLILVGFDAE